MTNPNFGGQPQMRGHVDRARDWLKSNREQADRQYASWRQAKDQISLKLQQINQRKEELAGKLQSRIQLIRNPQTAKQFQDILADFQRQFAAGRQEVKRQAEEGRMSIQGAHRGSELPAQEIFDTALAAERQAVERLNTVIDAFVSRAKTKESAIWMEGENVKKTTDQMLANYIVSLGEAAVLVERASADQRAAERVLDGAKVNAAAQSLPQLTAKRTKLDGERGTEQRNLDSKRADLENAKTTVQSETEAKARIDALSNEIGILETGLQMAKDEANAKRVILDRKRADAEEGPVKANYFTKPTAVTAIAACNADAEAEKAAVTLPVGPAQVAEIEAIESKRVKDIQLIQSYFDVKTESDKEKRKVVSARKLLNESIAKVGKEEADLDFLPVAVVGSLEGRIDNVRKERQKRMDTAQKDVNDLSGTVTALEKEMGEKYTQPLQALDAQIKALQDPITKAQEALQGAKEKIKNLKNVVKTPASQEQQKAFLAQARALLAQINKEGILMRGHFRGVEGVEARTIDLIKRRTDIAAEVAERSKEEQDIRAALVYLRSELVWLNQQADRHAARIVELQKMEPTLAKTYCDMLQQKTKATNGKPFPDRWQAIQREMMALQEYQPVTGKARIEVLKNGANTFLTGRHDEFQQKTDQALIAAEQMGVSEEIMRHALSTVEKEQVFLKQYGDRNGRLSVLRGQHDQLSKNLAAMLGQELRREATELTAGLKDRAGRIETVKGLIATEQRLGQGVNVRSRQDVESLKQEQLVLIAQETDRLLVAAINNPDRNTKKQALIALAEEAVLLQEHFLDRSRDRTVQLLRAAEELLKQIVQETDAAVARCTPQALEPQFREGYRLVADERAFRAKNLELRSVQPERSNELAAKELQLDSNLVNGMERAIESARVSSTVADIDMAQRIMRLLQERVPFVAGDSKVVVTATLEKAQNDLATVRAKSAEREGLERANREVDVQGSIDEIVRRLSYVQIESPAKWIEGGQREQMLAQLRTDIQTLQQNLSRASNTQRIRMESLITQISDAIWEKLNTQDEKIKIYRGNFLLMMQEAKAKVIEMQQRVQSPTLEKYGQRIQAGQAVFDKAQRYINVAESYGMDKKQVQALRAAMGDLMAEIARTEKIVQTYQSRSTPRRRRRP